MPLPALLLVHGAWHSARTWIGLRPALEKHGYVTHVVELPSVGLRPDPPSDHLEDVAAVRAALGALIKSGNRVLVVAHSYGGIPGSSAVDGFEDGVVGIVFIDALCTPLGKTTGEIYRETKGFMPAEWRRMVNDSYDEIVEPQKAFYNDVTPAEAEPWTADLRPRATTVLNGKITYVAWRHVPCAYVDCTESAVLTKYMKEAMIQNMEKECKFPLLVKNIKASHTPMIKHEAELVRIIRDAAGETDVET